MKLINMEISVNWQLSNISPWNFINNYHPYRIWYILNLCLASGIFAGAYAVGKGSILLYISTLTSQFSSFFVIILFILAIVYPLLWTWLIYPIVRSGSHTNITSRSIKSGTSLTNKYIIIWTFFTIFQIYLFLFPIFTFM